MDYLDQKYRSYVTEDDGVYNAERVRARLEAWDSVGMDWVRVKANSSGELVTSGGGGGGGGTEYTEDAASIADPVGGQIMARRRDSLATETSTDGDVTALNSTAKGELYVKHVDSIPVTDNGGSLTVDGTLAVSSIPGTYLEDDPHVSGDRGMFLLAVRNSAMSTLTSLDGDYSPISADSAGRANIAGQVAHDAAQTGNPISIGGLASAAAPTDVSADGDSVRLWALRNGAQVVNIASGGTLITGDGANGLDVDVTRVQGTVVVGDGGGSITVDGTVTADAGTGPWPVTDNGGSLTVDDGGSSLTIDGSVSITGSLPAGTNNIGDVDVLTMPGTFAEDDPHSSGQTGNFVLAVRNTAMGTQTSADGDYSPFTVDSAGRANVSGQIAHDSAINGNPLAIAAVASAAAPTDVGADQRAVRIWALRNGSLVTNIAAGGTLITGDGTNGLDVDVTRVQGTVTVDSELPAASSLSDNEANPSVPRVGAMGMVWDGATWDRQTQPLTDTQLRATAVPVSGTVTIQDGGNVISVDDAGSTLSVDDGGGSLTVDGSVTALDEDSSTGTHANFTGSGASQTIIASNASRKGSTVYNDSGVVCYVKLGATASSTSFTVKMVDQSYYEVPFKYTGVIDALWASGSVRVVEFT